MRIKKEITLSYIDSLYEKFEEIKDTVDINLPIQGIRERNFAAFSSFVQFFSTWLRSSKKGNLIFETIDENWFKGIIESNTYAFVVSALSWNLNINDSQGSDIKSHIKKNNSRFLDKAKNLVPLGSELLLACFDFDRSLENRGLLRLLYDNNGVLKDDAYFKFNLVPELLTALGKKYSLQQIKNSFTKEDYLNIGEIVYELFKNTHEWGRTKEDKISLLAPNVRAIDFVIHRSNQKNFKEYAEGSIGLQNYLSSNIFVPNTNNEIFFLEITIMDSGIGFIRQFLGSKYIKQTVTIDKQVEIIKKCLTKYFSTSQSQMSGFKGKGLDRVLRSLDKKGFLRIRCENVCVYRNLIKDDYSKITDSNGIDLYDWKTNSATKFTSFPFTEGTSISLIYPIKSL